MRPLLGNLFLFFVLFLSAPALRGGPRPGVSLPVLRAQQSGVQITSPLPGEAVQGIFVISGSTFVDGFFSYEVSFGFPGDPTGTWFLIAEGFNPVVEAPLAEWDTFALTDGSYSLRLLVTLVDGSTLETIAEGIRVRNYSVIETSTPTSSPTITNTSLASETPPSRTPRPEDLEPPTPTRTATITPTPTETGIPPTATALPENPAYLSAARITNTLARGAAGALIALLFLGIYLSIRRIRR